MHDLTFEIKDQTFDLPKITRVEVIDEDGRSYVNWDKNSRVRISIQDNLKTLKIFITDK